ncbi:CbiX/SirB N-terminal domain-containing protein, partial [Natrinema soli]
MSTPDQTTPASAAGFDDEAVLLIGHGSRREKSNEQVRELAADLESRLGIPDDAAFLEFVERKSVDPRLNRV